VTGPVRTATRHFGIAAILLGSILVSTGCGSVTAKKSDGGTGGSPTDSSTKQDARYDAPENHDSSSAKDMRMTDTRASDAPSHGGSGGGGAGGKGGSGGGAGGKGGSGGGAGGKGGIGGSGAGGAGVGGKGGIGGSGAGGAGVGGKGGIAGSGAGGVGGTPGGGGAAGAGVSECKSNGDCVLYPGAGSGCCGVCQPASDPAPPPIECLLACSSLLTVKTCGCVNNQCVGSKTQL
jgi:hypothetical protein